MSHASTLRGRFGGCSLMSLTRCLSPCRCASHSMASRFWTDVTWAVTWYGRRSLASSTPFNG